MRRRSFLGTVGGAFAVAAIGGCGAAEDEAGVTKVREYVVGTDEAGHTVYGLIVRRERTRLLTVESMPYYDGRPVMIDDVGGERALSGHLVFGIPGVSGSESDPHGHVVEYWDGTRWIPIGLPWHLQTVVSGGIYRVTAVAGGFVYPSHLGLTPEDGAAIEAEERWALGG